MVQTPMYPKKHFRGQTQDEEVILFLRKHWIVLLKFFFYLLLLIVMLILNTTILLITVSSSPLSSVPFLRIYFTVSGLLMLIFGIYIFTNLINYYLDIVIITNLRVVEVHKTIFFKNKVHAVDLKNIQEINADKEGFIANSLGFGNIILSSHTANFEKMLITIPTPHYYADVITKVQHGNTLQNGSRSHPE